MREAERGVQLSWDLMSDGKVECEVDQRINPASLWLFWDCCSKEKAELKGEAFNLPVHLDFSPH